MPESPKRSQVVQLRSLLRGHRDARIAGDAALSRLWRLRLELVSVIDAIEDDRVDPRRSRRGGAVDDALVSSNREPESARLTGG